MSALEGYSGGYPYLRIARHYGVDYGDVLSCASYLLHADKASYWEKKAVWSLTGRQDVHGDICIAIAHFKAVQAGQIGMNAPHGAARAPT